MSLVSHALGFARFRWELGEAVSVGLGTDDENAAFVGYREE